jgi:hypothetical protein
MSSSKTPLRFVLFAALCLLALAATYRSLRADEGMWTYDNPPLAQLRERYGFTPPPGWLDHLRLSSVRFNSGGSGSFISSTGLVLTNHHIALDQLEKASTAEHNYVRDGFYARRTQDELKSADLEVNVLVSLEEVTSRVMRAAEAAGNDAQKALDARRQAIAAIERESQTATGLRSDVVSLYQGGEYWLYRYKKYTDIRLVFAPEQQIAFYGGDPDNFTYPRYDLDFAVFRIYENGQPVTGHDFLRWKSEGAADGELVFVSGHPGSTSRLETVAQLETARDLIFPTSIEVVTRRLAVLARYSATGGEAARQAGGITFELANALKAYKGQYQGLLDAKLFAKKQTEEREFRDRLRSNAEWSSYESAWETIAQAERERRNLYLPSRFQSLRGSDLAGLASQLVQYIAEKAKPDPERLPGFHESQVPALELRLYSPAPIYPALEEALLADALDEAAAKLGAADPFITAILGGRTGAQVAHDAIAGTKLIDPAARKALVASGPAGLAASTDPLVVLARTADPFVKRNRELTESRVESIETPAQQRVGQARFKVYGHAAYPDATFTLRLSFGAVKDYPMNGTKAPTRTTFYGLYDRAYSFGLKPPFDLPSRYLDKRAALDLSTPLNFVSTNDIIGGNSGSPVVNRQGELVGLIFDGNIESLVGEFVYSEDTNRAVAVHSAAIIEALRKLYDAAPLADEIVSGGSRR